MSEPITILLRLLIAHLFAELIFQFSSGSFRGGTPHWKARGLYLQALISAGLAYLLAGLWLIWWLPLLVFLLRIIVGIWKEFRPRKSVYVFTDQLLYVLMLALIWVVVFDKWQSANEFFAAIYSDSQTLLILSAYLFISWPMGILIGMATQKWRDEAGVNAEGLARAGMWIGFFERFLILTFILINQYTAVGLLIAAKSILRFNDKEASTQRKTEYVLIGTLMSFSASVLLAWLIGLALQFI